MAETAHDLVVRGGLVADGRGGEPRAADVAVDGGTITAVGTGAGPGRRGDRRRRPAGHPGLRRHPHALRRAGDVGRAHDAVELARRDDGGHGQLRRRLRTGAARCAPAPHLAHGRASRTFPAPCSTRGSTGPGRASASTSTRSSGGPHDIDLCAQLPHGALRLYVMGERAARLEEATPRTTRRPCARLATEALRAGAIGFSTSRTLNHRTASGDPTPSLRAGTDELEAIALGVADAGHGVVELISDFWPDTDGEFELVRAMVARTGVPLSLSLAQSHRHPEAWRDLLRPDRGRGGRRPAHPGPGRAAPGRAAGRAAVLVPPAPRASRPTRTSPALPVAEQARALRDPAFRARLLADMESTDDAGDGAPARRAGGARSTTGASTRSATCPTTSPRPRRACCGWPRRGASTRPRCCSTCCPRTTAATSSTPRSPTTPTGTSTPAARCSPTPHTVFGLGDGGAHVGLISDASFPTYALSHWARDRAHGRMEVGRVVEQLTSATATAVGLRDRGVLAAGMRADLNVIDFDHLACAAPVMAYDLPAGGKRLLQGARGYRATVVAGAVTYRDGEPTGALPGRLVRGGRDTARAPLAS